MSIPLYYFYSYVLYPVYLYATTVKWRDNVELFCWLRVCMKRRGGVRQAPRNHVMLLNQNYLMTQQHYMTAHVEPGNETRHRAVRNLDNLLQAPITSHSQQQIEKLPCACSKLYRVSPPRPVTNPTIHRGGCLGASSLVKQRIPVQSLGALAPLATL